VLEPIKSTLRRADRRAAKSAPCSSGPRTSWTASAESTARSSRPSTTPSRSHWAFKTPTLRNVGLTAPYFHSGAKPTLEDVIEFYDRGGDFANPQRSADIVPLHLTALDKAALVDFLRNGLTDCRVVNQRAPFDHPELPVLDGTDLPAVGAEGIGPCR
jgi:hypothetical protein